MRDREKAESRSPLVGYICTVRNGMPFIKEAIASIQAQTYANWEAVIVDDGSSDTTWNFLSSIAKSDWRFSVIRGGAVGRGAALNTAWKASSGVYICNLDADDLAHPTRAEIQVEALEESLADLHAGRCVTFQRSEEIRWSNDSRHALSSVNVSRKLLWGNPISHSGAMIRRTSLIKVGGYSEGRRSQFDYDLWAKMASAGMVLVRSDVIVGAKRIHPEQSFENKSRSSYLLATFSLQNDVISRLGGGWRHRGASLIRVAYGLLPQRIRMQVRRILVSPRNTRVG